MSEVVISIFAYRRQRVTVTCIHHLQAIKKYKRGTNEVAATDGGCPIRFQCISPSNEIRPRYASDTDMKEKTVATSDLANRKVDG